MSGDARTPEDCMNDAAAFVLGALESGEAEEYERHLDACAVCRDEVAALRRVAGALPMAAPQYRPPPSLRRRVLRAVRSEAGRSSLRPRPRPAIAVRVALATALATTALAIAALVIANIGATPGPKTVQARVTGSAGTAEVRISGGHAELIARHLPPPAAGRIYELWLRRGGAAPAPTRALFSVSGAGAADVGVPGDLHDVTEILVTEEPAGGSRVPTGAPVIVAPTS